MPRVPRVGALSDPNRGLAPELLAPLLDHAIDLARNVCGAQRAAAFLMPDATGVRRVLVQQPARGWLPLRAIGGIARLVESHAELVVRDLARAEQTDWQAAARAGARSAVAVRLRVGTYRGCLVVARDSARPLGVAHARRLRQLADSVGLAGAAIRTAVVSEGRRLARDLHDTFGQTITCLVFAIDELEGATWSSDHRLLMRGVRTYALRAIREMRELMNVAAEGTPRPCEGLGDIAQLARSFSGAGVTVRVHADATPDGVGAEAEACLHHVVREALVNVVRHARARHVDVSLRHLDGALELIVADDGTGLVEDETARAGWGGFGLRMMRERTEDIGGTFDLQSTPRTGTRITVRVPHAGSRAGHREAGAGPPRR